MTDPLDAKIEKASAITRSLVVVAESETPGTSFSVYVLERAKRLLATITTLRAAEARAAERMTALEAERETLAARLDALEAWLRDQARRMEWHEPQYAVHLQVDRVRPYRDGYRHVGALQQLVDDAGTESHRVRTGGCGTITTMGRALSETYARNPKFYSHTFCVHCNRHLPVSEFVWTADGFEVGS